MNAGRAGQGRVIDDHECASLDVNHHKAFIHQNQRYNPQDVKVAVERSAGAGLSIDEMDKLKAAVTYVRGSGGALGNKSIKALQGYSICCGHLDLSCKHICTDGFASVVVVSYT